MKRFTALMAMVFVLAFVMSALGQEKKTVNGGVLNGRAKSLPNPEYPDAAKAAKVAGVVAVDVEIDESGNIISTKADLYDQRTRFASDGTKLDPVIADQMLRDAAEAAALRATFEPTLLQGQPVRVKGRIMYNFVTDHVEAMTAGPQTVKTVTAVKTVNEAEVTMPKMVSGGVLNGKATSLPSPAYPPAAKAVNAEGAVSIQVLIDEGGNIIAATAVSGHPLLRAAAEAAAREAKFSQTKLCLASG